MPKNTVLGIIKDYASFFATFVNGDGTSFKTLYTFPTDDAHLIMLTIASSDTVNRDIQFALTTGGVDAPTWLVSVPLGSGTSAGINIVNGLNATSCPFALYDDTGLNRYIPGTAGVILKARPLVAVSSTQTITIFGTVGRFAA